MHDADLAHEESDVQQWTNNDERMPMHIPHEIFNQHELLKSLLEDELAEGM